MEQIKEALADFRLSTEKRLDKIEFQTTTTTEQLKRMNGNVTMHEQRINQLERTRYRIEGASGVVVFLVGTGFVTAMGLYLLG